MKTLIRYAFTVLLLGMVFVTTNTSTVSACSGGSPLTLKALIKFSDYVVKARVAEVDDVRQNAILRIESYLAGGSGPEYLLLMNNDPIFTTYILAGRSSGGDCLGLFQTSYTEDPMYLFLSRGDDGSYSIITTLFNPYSYSFPKADSEVEVFLKGGIENGGNKDENFSEKDGGQKVTEREFVKLIAQESGEQPSLPLPDAHYPLKAPLKLIAASGKQFVLPVDGKLPFELTDEVLKEQERRYPMDAFGFSDAGRCDIEGCKSISPDGINIAVQTDHDTITLT